MPHTNLDQAHTVARRIDHALETQKFESIDSTVSATFGIAQFNQGEDSAAFTKRLQSAVTKAQQSPGDAGRAP